MEACVGFIREQLDNKFMYLVIERGWCEESAKSYIEHMILDFRYFILGGVIVRPILMNPDGHFIFNSYKINEFIDISEYLPYYCITSAVSGDMVSIKVPVFEMNNEGIPHVYETEELANESLKLYIEYFRNPHLEITKYGN